LLRELVKPRRSVLLAAVFAGLAIMVAACGTTTGGTTTSGGTTSAAGGAANGAPLKIGMVLDNEPNDQGWGQTWINAAKDVQRQFGSKVNLTWRYSVPDPETAQAINQLISQGSKVIITTTFGEQQAALEIAAQHPEVTFLSCEAVKTLPNLATVDHLQSDGVYVAGMAAAAVAKGSNQLGLVDTFPIPLYIAMANAWQLGAQQINPAVKTRVVFSNDWVDPSKGQRSAQALVRSGAKALTSFMAGPGVLAPVAKSENVPWAGLNVDMKQYAPQQYLTSVLLDWGPWMKAQISAILDHKWNSGSYLLTLQNGGIKLAPWGDALKAASAADRQKIEAALKGISDGSRSAFEGPIKDQSGKVRVPAGSHATVDQVRSSDYFVEGIEGSIPK
jgi:basic membrane lipoprotein Med (substrate-binding protein (PBP1-ABC) superfamily)